MKICENCNYVRVPDNAIFCPHCGSEFQDLPKVNIEKNIETEIDLTSAQGWKRLLNFFIDGFPLMTLATLASEGDENIKWLFFYLFVAIYYLLFEGVFGRTLGKLITKTIVVDSTSFRKASFGKILGRTFSRLIPLDVLSFLFSIIPGWHPRGWHDSISKPEFCLRNI